MVYKGRAKGNIIVLDHGISLPDGTEVEVVPALKPGEKGMEDLQERTALGAKMSAFSERIAAREINLSDLILEARQELDGRA